MIKSVQHSTKNVCYSVVLFGLEIISILSFMSEILEEAIKVYPIFFLKSLTEV